MIAPHFESLATKYTKPKRIAFVKVDVEKLRDVASQHGVRAMPTFIIFKNGSPIETIQGANPPKLTQAVENAVKLAGPSVGSGFSAPGRTLGGPGIGGGASRPSLRRPLGWDLNNLINAIIGFFGLYLVSLFTVSTSLTRLAHCALLRCILLTLPQLDPYKTAETSRYNVRNPVAATPIAGASKDGAGAGVKKPAPKTTFRTLADLGGD